MFENVYKRFFDIHGCMFLVLLKEIDLLDVQVLLIDFDYYARHKDMRNSLYICDTYLLPSYAKEKMLLYHSKDYVVCLKHGGLCLITSLDHLL
ncbi:MAG: hypothetical protein CMB64_03995 [Euryarchaeota archaeon]|nr:hypothetical protein [Euryarchaeota archaeon]